MKKGIILLVGVAMLTACHESLEERAEREAKEFTEKNCPTPVRENTRTDSLTYDKESRTIGYWYTLCGQADNAEAIEADKEKLVGILRNELKASTQMKAYMDAGFGIRYVYHSEKNPQHFILMKFLQQHISF